MMGWTPTPPARWGRRRAARLGLLVMLLVVLMARAHAALAPRGRSTASSSRYASPTGRELPQEAHDEDEDEDEDEDDEWDFMSDDALSKRPPGHQTGAPTRASGPCAAALDPARINDDYCDCPDDGSDEPETAACAGVTVDMGSTMASAPEGFRCRAPVAALLGPSVPGAFVRDGVCDCCDGSDEVPGGCPDVCQGALRRRLTALWHRRAMVQRGIDHQAAVLPSVPGHLTALAAELEEIHEITEALQRAFQYRQQQLQRQSAERGAPPGPQEMHALEQTYYQLRQWQVRAFVQGNVLQDQEIVKARPAMAALIGECFDFTVNEKQLKGGSSNVVPREYVIVFCPFQNVTQTEPAYNAWQRAERRAKLGDLVGDDGDDEDGEATATATTTTTQAPIIMGLWGQWRLVGSSPSPTVPTSGDDATTAMLVYPKTQEYEHGEQCANGQARRVSVTVSCGAESRVLGVEEHEMCVYSLSFATPGVCDAKQIDAIEEAMDQLEQAAGASHSTRHEEL